MAGSSPRPELPIGLIALDIDGTLVDDDLVIGRRTLETVAEAQRRGVAISLVTGRMATSATPFAETLGLTGPIVSQQGALVRSMPLAAPGRRRPGLLLYHRPIRPEVVLDIVRWCHERNLMAHFNHLEWMIVGAEESRIDEYRAFVGDRLRVVDDIMVRAHRPVTKVVALGEGEHSLELMEEGRACFAGRAEVTLSHPRFLEFLAPGVSKGRAVRWLARRLGMPLGRCMAIGDQYNDLEMIREVGHGVAMPTAPAAVQAVARFVAPPVAEEGAAQMIERIALDGWHAPAARAGGRPGGRAGGRAGVAVPGSGPATVTDGAFRGGIKVERR